MAPLPSQQCPPGVGDDDSVDGEGSEDVDINIDGRENTEDEEDHDESRLMDSDDDAQGQYPGYSATDYSFDNRNFYPPVDEQEHPTANTAGLHLPSGIDSFYLSLIISEYYIF